MRAKHITVADVQFVAHELARKFMEWDEPIPDFGTRFPGVLESCLRQPFATYERKTLYRGLIGKTAILFYLMIKNHPFQNGNKRIAVTTLLTFLYLNRKWLTSSNTMLYQFAKDVAESDSKKKDKTVDSIRRFLKAHLTSIQ